jgi:holin-like protein
MAQSFLTLLICQSLGELVHQLAGVPLSGPILGMVLLLALMLARGGPSTDLRASATSLLGYLSLLFVPAAVGIMPYLPVLRAQWLPVAVALLVSTVLAMGSSALIVQRLNRRTPALQTHPPIAIALEQVGGGE